MGFDMSAALEEIREIRKLHEKAQKAAEWAEIDYQNTGDEKDRQRSVHLSIVAQNRKDEHNRKWQQLKNDMRVAGYLKPGFPTKEDDND